MPKELDAIARTRNAQMLAAALPAVEAEIDEQLNRADTYMVGAIRGGRLTSEDAFAYCHAKAAMFMLKARLTSRSTPSKGDE